MSNPFTGGVVLGSRDYSWIAIDAECWSGDPVRTDADAQDALRTIDDKALRSLGLRLAEVDRRTTGTGSIVALPGEIAKADISAQFVEALRQAVLDHDFEYDQGNPIRLRVALNSGAVTDEDEWAAGPAITALRLVESPVIKRVLAAAARSPLALITSAAWHDAVRNEGYPAADGYQQVWIESEALRGPAWIRVPGRSWPPGLLPEDAPATHRQRDVPGAQSRQWAVAEHHFSGSVSADKVTVVQAQNINGGMHIGNVYGSGPVAGPRRPGGNPPGDDRDPRGLEGEK